MKNDPDLGRKFLESRVVEFATDDGAVCFDDDITLVAILDDWSLLAEWVELKGRR